ncbi:MAG: hypothetical protein ACJAT1_000761 [Marivirga sp.]
MGIKTIFRLLPWLLVLVLFAFLWIRRMTTSVTPQKFSIEQTTSLQEIEALGKLELVKYRFKEVIEAGELANCYLDVGVTSLPVKIRKRSSLQKEKQLPVLI